MYIWTSRVVQYSDGPCAFGLVRVIYVPGPRRSTAGLVSVLARERKIEQREVQNQAERHGQDNKVNLSKETDPKNV